MTKEIPIRMAFVPSALGIGHSFVITQRSVDWTTTPRSADFQSAVSPISNRQIFDVLGLGWIVFRPARWKRAIQQIGNLRYGAASGSVAYLEHWSVWFRN